VGESRAVRLDPADIERIADAVATRLDVPGRPAAVRLVDAAAVAAALGVERHWVYSHADELGAVRIGSQQGRLRFDLAHVLRTLQRGPTPAPPPGPPCRRSRGHPRRSRRSSVELIPYDRTR